MSAAIVVVVGGVFAVVKFVVNSSEGLLRAGGSNIEIRQVVLVNGAGESRLADGAFVQTEASAPQLDITVRNTGASPALLTEAHIEIEDSALLAVCEYSSGDVVPSSKEYAVSLPILPTLAERVVRHPLHQEVGANEVDRFKILFRTPYDGPENYIYALRVALIGEDSKKPVDIGRFVIGVPESVNRGGRILPEGPYPFGVLNDEEQLVSTWCARRNLAAVERLLQHDGRRSSSMDALKSMRPANWWSSFADRRAPRAAIGPLLRAQVGYGPTLAVFAAERDGDRRLIRETRMRAARLLLRQAKEAQRGRFAYQVETGVLAARYALLFSPSEEAQDTLDRAEARLASVEAEAPPAGSD